MDSFNLQLPPIFFEWFTPISTSYILIIAAEIGDKSQLVCMSLAARHRAAPVILGAIAAFALLNTLAVVFGVAIANWIPDYIVAGVVAILFAIFGLHALFLSEDDSEDEDLAKKSGHGIFLSTFLLITVAEFADKTQLAVVALSSTDLPLAIWIGATFALATTTIIGVAAGRSLLNKIPLSLLHKISGLIFIILAGFATYKALILMPFTLDSIRQLVPTAQ